MSTLIPAWVDGGLSTVEKLEVHRRGLRHPAVSVFVMDGEWTLLQRRALGKYHTPGLWANACCTHPAWQEPPARCAQRRLQEELGIAGLLPVARGEVEYRAEVGGGLTEHEIVTLYTVAASRATLRLRPNPDEVAEVRWITLDDLETEVRETPAQFTPWLRIYLGSHRELLR